MLTRRSHSGLKDSFIQEMFFSLSISECLHRTCDVKQLHRFQRFSEQTGTSRYRFEIISERFHGRKALPVYVKPGWIPVGYCGTPSTGPNLMYGFLLVITHSSQLGI